MSLALTAAPSSREESRERARFRDCLRFSCPVCASWLEVPRSMTGTEGPCPVCGSTIISPAIFIPSPSFEPAPKKTQPLEEEPKPTKLEPPDTNTAKSRSRLCDLPPRPHFSARGTSDDGELPVRKRLRRRGYSRRREILGFLRREFVFLCFLFSMLALGWFLAKKGLHQVLPSLPNGVESPRK